MNNVSLSKIERLLLHNQYKVLAALYPNEAKNYANAMEILDSGYALDYAQLLESVDEEVPRATCEHVLDVLQMYRLIHLANEELPKAERFPDEAIRVIGFDGNNEGDELSYARYFTRDGRRFTELTDGGKRQIPNSHHPTRDRYGKMLSALNASADKNALTRADIDRIVNVAPARLDDA